MNNKSITPNPQQPVDRIPTGQLPSALAELSEAELSARGVLPTTVCGTASNYDGKTKCAPETCGGHGEDLIFSLFLPVPFRFPVCWLPTIPANNRLPQGHFLAGLLLG